MDETTLKFIIQELTSWPVMALIIVVLLLKPLKEILFAVNNIKFGKFSLSLQKLGEALGVPNALKEISSLSYEELKLFLILCGEDADYYEFVPYNMTAVKLSKIIDKLVSSKLLIREDVPAAPQKPAGHEAASGPAKPAVADSSTAAHQPMVQFKYLTTETGRKVHRAFLDSIYQQLIQTKTQSK